MKKSFKYGNDKKFTFAEKQKTISKYKALSTRTLAEREFSSILNDLGVWYCEQKGFLVGAETFCIVDFYIPRPHKVAFEVDGKYHESRQIYDSQKEAYLRTRGIKTVRFTNDQVINDPVYVSKSVEQALML